MFIYANDDILKRMGRKTSKQELIDIVGKLRKEIPDICLRTTLITGFPGETQEQYEELYRFVSEMEFDRLGVFTYSPEEDTPAALMLDQIEESVKEERQAELMELQQEIAFEAAENMVGKEVLVMIEGKVADENVYVGRTFLQNLHQELLHNHQLQSLSLLSLYFLFLLLEYPFL